MNEISKFFILIVLSFLLSNCNTDNEFSDDTDITMYSWKVEHIKDGIWKTKVPKKDYHGNAISSTDYILSFTTDSIFSLSLGINFSGGHYEIESTDIITLYGGFTTEICCDSKFDEKLSALLPEIKTYFVSNNTLILEGDKISIELKKD